MTQKNETQTEAKTKPETKVVPEAKTVPEKPVKKPTTSPNPNEQTNSSRSVRGRTGDLSPELTELVNELRDTVKHIDPRRHTAKTLRRSLSNVSDILNDIEQLYPES